MFCPKCGTSAGDSAKFCPKCGASFGSSDSAPSRLRISGASAPASSPPTEKTPAAAPKVPAPKPPVAPAPAPDAPRPTDAARQVRKAASRKEPGQPGSTLWVTGVLVAALVIAVVLAGSVCFLSSARFAPDEAVMEDENAGLMELMAEGNAAYSLEDYSLAKEFYLEAMERFPQEPDVLCRLADACYALCQEDSALQYYQMAVMLYGEDGSMPILSAQNFYNLTEE